MGGGSAAVKKTPPPLDKTLKIHYLCTTPPLSKYCHCRSIPFVGVLRASGSHKRRHLPKGMVIAKGPPRGPRQRHEPCLREGGSSPAPASQPAVSAVRVNGDAIAVKERRHLPKGMVTAKGPPRGPPQRHEPCLKKARRQPQGKSRAASQPPWRSAVPPLSGGPHCNNNHLKHNN